MNEKEIERIGAEAAAEESQEQQQFEQQTAAAAIVPAAQVDMALAQEFAEVLNLLARFAEVGTKLPVTQRYSQEANLEIAKAAIKLCTTYGYDARKLLIGEDSKLGVWVGLGLAIGLPGWMTYQDWKVLRAKEVKAANDETSQQQSQ